ncbi:MAG: hypothetical protein KA734_03915 [Fluviicola sp.]|nr:hypothetical protein [Fluviicola sp.]
MKLFVVIATLLLFLPGCSKNKNHPIASIPFDFQIDLSLPSYQDLNGVGGWAYVNGGIKGIIVYRQSTDVFVAWERQSPEDPTNACATGLTPNSGNFLQLEDPCSDAVFSLYDGSPIANSDWGLRQYRADWYGGNILRLYN